MHCLSIHNIVPCFLNALTNAQLPNHSSSTQTIVCPPKTLPVCPKYCLSVCPNHSLSTKTPVCQSNSLLVLPSYCLSSNQCLSLNPLVCLYVTGPAFTPLSTILISIHSYTLWTDSAPLTGLIQHIIYTIHIHTVYNCLSPTCLSCLCPSLGVTVSDAALILSLGLVCMPVYNQGLDMGLLLLPRTVGPTRA